MEWFRFALTAALVVTALVTVLLSVLGVFRFHFVLNRMHSASMLDSCAVLLISLSVVVHHGLHAADWKLLLLIVFLWIGSPIASHMLARLEVMTDSDLTHHLKVEQRKKEAQDHDRT